MAGRERQGEVSAPPHARGGAGWGRSMGACGQGALRDRPQQTQATRALFPFTLRFLLSSEGGHKGGLCGPLWGADWAPSHHMVNKCCHCPTAEQLLHLINWQQPLP